MKNPVRNGVIGLILGASLWAIEPAWSQQTDPQALQAALDQAARRAQPRRSVESFGPEVSVNFPGGTVEEYIATLQQAAGEEPVNVVTPAVAKRVVLPPIQLRNVTVYTALSAVRSAFEENSEHQFQVRTIGSDYDATFSLEYQRISPSVRGQPGPFGPPSNAKQLQVYSIRDLIEPAMEGGGVAASKVAFQDILSAVEAAMQLLDQEEAPRMLFHKETGLLMVGGTSEQNTVVDKLLMRIREDMQRRWSEERHSRRASAERERRLTVMRNEVRLAELEMAQAGDRLKRLELRVEGGLEPKESLSQAVLEYERAKANLERKQLELQSVEEEKEGGETTSTSEMYDVRELVASPETRRLLQASLKQVEGARLIWGEDSQAVAVEGTADQRRRVKEVIDHVRGLAKTQARDDK